MRTVILASWVEFERGWGQRPDGYSYHLTLDDAKRFEDIYIDNETSFYQSNGVYGVPDCYSRMSVVKLVDVPNEIYYKLLNSDCGIWK